MKLGVIAGERSGDGLGARLLQQLGTAEAFGVAGPAMMAAGCRPIGRIEELELMGIAEVAREVPRVLRLLARVEREILREAPQVVLTIDSPSFCLRLARRLKGRVRVVHWVSPQIWAWRGYRADRIARSVDAIACVLPFEPALYRGVDARFTGHPAVDLPWSTRPEALGIAAGSRPSERAALGPVFRRVALRTGLPIVEAVPRGCTPTVPEARCVEGAAAMAESVKYALVCSGTATLEVAASGVPMVAAYAPHWLTRQLAKRLLHVPSTVLPNLVLGKSIVPEFHPPDERSLMRGLETLDVEDQRQHFRQLRGILQPEGAIERVISLLG